MKKIIIGALSLGIVAAGGVTVAQAQSDQMEMPNEQVMDMSDMHQEMLESNGEINFGQAKKFMSDMHPEWNTKEMKQMYQSMHGTNGAAPSANFKHMNMNMNK